MTERPPISMYPQIALALLIDPRASESGTPLLLEWVQYPVFKLRDALYWFKSIWWDYKRIPLNLPRSPKKYFHIDTDPSDPPEKDESPFNPAWLKNQICTQCGVVGQSVSCSKCNHALYCQQCINEHTHM